MGFFKSLRTFFGSPHPQPDAALYRIDLTPAEQKAAVEKHLEEARLRLQKLKLDVDVIGRRD